MNSHPPPEKYVSTVIPTATKAWKETVIAMAVALNEVFAFFAGGQVLGSTAGGQVPSPGGDASSEGDIRHVVLYYNSESVLLREAVVLRAAQARGESAPR